MKNTVKRLTGNAARGGSVLTRYADVPIHRSTAAWASRCLTGVAVISRTMEADIMIAKITPTMEFSAPKIH